ncbi:MAG: FxsA family protein [Planctomycetes bacterium]|nr:FxsA family protein [Planctomycetota bacterium]
MKRLGCLGILILIGIFCLELYLYLVIGHYFGNEYLLPLIVMVAMGVAGFQVVRYHLTRLPKAMLGGRGGRHIVGLVAGGLLIFPGLGTDALGLLMLVPGIYHLLGRVGDVIAISLARQGMRKMFGAQLGGAFGGAFGGGGFSVPSPDDSAAFPRRPKTYDAEAETVEDPKLDKKKE